MLWFQNILGHQFSLILWKWLFQENVKSQPLILWIQYVIKYCTSFCWSTQQQNSWVLVLRKYWWNHSRSSYLMQDTFDVKSLCAGPTLSVLTRSWLNENGIASCIWSLVSSLRVWESCTILRKLTKFPSTWSGRAVWSRMRSLKWTALKCIKVLNSWTCEGFPVWRL